MRSTRFLTLSLVSATLALPGCSVTPRDTRASYEAMTDITATATPMARIAPEAGEVVSVLQNREGGVLTQRIVLKGDAATGGENAIVVKVNQGPRRMGDIDGPVPKPSESSIVAELNEEFPSFDMPLSQAFNHNGFGPFGYAIGHPRANATCIYAWQWSLGRPPRLVDSPGAVASASSMPSVPTSVRVRLCRSNLSETELVAFVRDMQVFPPNSADPYEDPAYEGPNDVAGHDALSASGSPSRLYAGSHAETRAEAAPEPRRASPHRRERVRHAHRRRATDLSEARAAAEPSGSGVDVPLPGGPPASVGPSPSAGPVNPLLAPLQNQTGRKAAAIDDMPLPGRAKAPARETSHPDPKPVIAPVPLPN